MVISWGLKPFLLQEAFPVKLQAGQVCLGLSLLVVPPDVCRLVVLYLPLDVLLLLEVVAFGRVSSLHLDVSQLLEVVAFGRALSVLMLVLHVQSLVVAEIYLKFGVCQVSPLALFLLSSHPLTLQYVVMVGELRIVYVRLVVCKPAAAFLAFHSPVI